MGYIYPGKYDVCPRSLHMTSLAHSCPSTPQSGTQKLNVPWNKPFQHLIFDSLLRNCFFSGPHSLGVRYSDRFTSTFPQLPDEKEIPVPMLALVGAAVSLNAVSALSLRLTDVVSHLGPCLADRVKVWHT